MVSILSNTYTYFDYSKVNHLKTYIWLFFHTVWSATLNLKITIGMCSVHDAKSNKLKSEFEIELIC